MVSTTNLPNFPRRLHELLASLVFAAENSGFPPLHRRDAGVASPQMLGPSELRRATITDGYGRYIYAYLVSNYIYSYSNYMIIVTIWLWL